MSTGCCRSRRCNQVVWSCLLTITLIGCGVILYISYEYRENYNDSCEKCHENADTQYGISHAEKLTQVNCTNVCSSESCLRSASFVLDNMDTTVDPCDDFYTFSCGKYKQAFSRNDNYSVRDEMEFRIKTVLKDIMDKMTGPTGSKSAKIKMVYDSCMSYDASEIKATRSVQEILHRIGIEGWPNMSPTFEFTESSLERTLGKLNAFNEFAFVKFMPIYAFILRNETEEIFNLTVVHELSSMSEETEPELYESIILQVLRYFGVIDQNANKAWEDFSKIDVALAKLYEDSMANNSADVSHRDKTINCSDEFSVKTVAPLCETLRHFIEYSETGHLFSKHHLYVHSYYSNFVENILPMIKSFTHREVANYLALRFVLSHLDVLNAPLRNIQLSHPQASSFCSDCKVYTHKWEGCLGWFLSNMQHAVAQEYVPKEFSRDIQEEINKIVKIYLQEASNYVSDQKWIEGKGKYDLEQSISNTKNDVKDWVEWLNKTTMNSKFENFHPTNQSFLQNVVEYRRSAWNFFFLNFKYHEEIKKELFAVNAYHKRGQMGIQFGLMMPPVYQHGLPKLLNLVTVGLIIGHEIGHEVTLFIEKIKKNKLSEEVKRIYLEKKKCIEQQYFEYALNKIGMKVNVTKTSDENVADIIAIEITQRVIDKYNQEDSGYPDFALPGLKFSTKQLFYISLAQLWCTVRSEARQEQYFNQDVHAPPHIRVTGMMRNLPEFSEAFNCPSDSNMNPPNLCMVRD